MDVESAGGGTSPCATCGQASKDKDKDNAKKKKKDDILDFRDYQIPYY